MNYLPVKKTTNVGAVVRKELLEGSQEQGYHFTKLNEKKPVILIMGGSGCSTITNETIRKNLSTLLINYQIIHICGNDGVYETIERVGYIQYKYVNDELKYIYAIRTYI